MDITKEEARELLIATAASNRTGLIGGPWSANGYTLDNALTILDRCTRVQREPYRRQDAVQAILPGYGDHVWYLSLEPGKENPWG